MQKMGPVHNSKKEKSSFNYPGALLLLWTVFACIVAIIIYVKLGGYGRSNLDGIFIGILLVLLISPVAKYLHPSLKKENQGLVLRKIERLVERGKYNKAKKLVEIHESSIDDTERIENIKKHLRDLGF